MSIQDLIASKSGSLTPTERRIARVVLDDPTQIAFGSVAGLAEKLKQQKGITITHKTIEGASHFFDPGMEEMIGTVEAYVRRRLTETSR